MILVDADGVLLDWAGHFDEWSPVQIKISRDKSMYIGI